MICSIFPISCLAERLHLLDGHPGHDIFPVDEIDTGNGAIGKRGKDFCPGQGRTA